MTANFKQDQSIDDDFNQKKIENSSSLSINSDSHTHFLQKPDLIPVDVENILDIQAKLIAQVRQDEKRQQQVKRTHKVENNPTNKKDTKNNKDTTNKKDTATKKDTNHNDTTTKNDTTNKKRNNNKSTNKTLQKTNDNEIKQVHKIGKESRKEVVDTKIVLNGDTEKKSHVKVLPIVKETTKILENSNSLQKPRKENDQKIPDSSEIISFKEDCLNLKRILPCLILDEDDKRLSTVKYMIGVFDPENIRILELKPDSSVEAKCDYFLDAQRQLMICDIDINEWHKYVMNVKGNDYMKGLITKMSDKLYRNNPWACLIISNVKDTDLDTYIDQFVNRVIRSSPGDDGVSPQYWANKLINRVLELKPDIEAKSLVNRINNVFRQNRLVYNTDELTTTNDILILRHIIDLIPKDSSYPSGFNSIPLLSRFDKQIYNPNSDVPHKDKYWHIGCLCASCNYHKRASDNYNYLIN
ncbi:unnamed protein product [[Candida] boidinii]|uniref:Unnamed protein product n=1 Tax=Candida boidinii TaxID=5477 RepID=A0ACB5TN96_CANBO|nr:unnamed protein product [[Candida] boidinii]